MPDVPAVQPTHLWDEDGLHAPDIDEAVHLKTVDRFRRTVNGDPVIVFTDSTTLTLFAPLERGDTYIPLSVLYREKATRGRPVPADREVRGLQNIADAIAPQDRTDGNIQRDPPSRPRPQAGSPTPIERPSRNKGKKSKT